MKNIDKQRYEYFRGVADNLYKVVSEINNRLEKAVSQGCDQPENKWHQDYLDLVAKKENLTKQAEDYERSANLIKEGQDVRSN